MLIAKGANPARDPVALRKSLRRSPHILPLLLRHGAKPSRLDLGFACEGLDETRAAGLFLQHGADAYLGEPSAPYLAIAATFHGAGTMRLLLRHGAVVNDMTWKGLTALEAACVSWPEWRNDNMEIVQLLLSGGAAVNRQEGHSIALTNACSDGNIAISRMLLEHGAAVNRAAEGGGTPLYAACRNFGGHGCDIDLLWLLLEHGADPNGRGARWGTPLQALCGSCEYREVDNTALVKGCALLLTRGADPTVCVEGSPYGSALHAACYHGLVSVVELLLRHGADVNAPGGSATPLQQACASRAASTRRASDIKRLVEMLLDHGAVPSAPAGKHGSALEAARKHNPSVVPLLVRHGAVLSEAVGREVSDTGNGE
ncbi:ankyrin repeat-containing domain protein [Microdochium trichocladiopsis]|uniref:Ankyrin repeat-containing domain protein n=1 Tax=Microdochium trichocladiopsis TaxID=1682393 RepID=A0A9P9BTU5_9PEZI|nr:ankyrin repeat-containing domain protein [Microdochium trichocladiopsis]KAH7035837.1 ankyrin repeat-containing domain protein [Microdochium trichocladiopsis]